MRSLLFLFALLAVAQSRYASSDESSAVEPSLDDSELPQADQPETTRNDIKPWLKNDPSRRFRGRHGHHGKHGSRHMRAENCTRKFKESEDALLKGLESDEKKEFWAIKIDDTLSRNQKREKLTEWADKVNRESEMTTYLEKKEEWRKSKSEDINSIVDGLGDKIRAIQEIVEDDDVVKSEQKERIGEILKEAPEPMFRVLHSLYPHYLKRSKRSHHNHYDPYRRPEHHDRHVPDHHHGRHHKRSVSEETGADNEEN